MENNLKLISRKRFILVEGNKEIFFESVDANKPAKFYLNSAPAHTAFPNKKVTKAEAEIVELGSLETANHRIIDKMIVNSVVQTCQVQMGMTELKTGSVWNTMPAHTHDRRMEVYFYFEIRKIKAFAILWDNRRKPDTFGCKTSRP